MIFATALVWILILLLEIYGTLKNGPAFGDELIWSDQALTADSQRFREYGPLQIIVKQVLPVHKDDITLP